MMESLDSQNKIVIKQIVLGEEKAGGVSMAAGSCGGPA